MTLYQGGILRVKLDPDRFRISDLNDQEDSSLEISEYIVREKNERKIVLEIPPGDKTE